ncbi:radical SAM domain-containing protein-like protein [Ostreococcus tauri]|uniref:Radical SAM domain-containing protein-like protein n=1 Tax=Ostreococcus tauri TaxID=70448 RepID=A0A1Y5I3P6_OSTTA|nr:radical SAM domain-containing protein-like protein [Ostreococcus tauri]
MTPRRGRRGGRVARAKVHRFAAAGSSENQLGDDDDDADDALAPTSVPRNAGVRDGPWAKADARAVTESIADAEETLRRAKASADGGVSLLGLTKRELEALAVERGMPKFRGKQMADHLYAANGTSARSVDEFTTLSKALRAELVAAGVRVGRSSVHHVAAATDGTAKLLLRLDDDRVVETGGFARNLAPHEIVDQVLALEEHFGQRVTNVVFMGMGEPLLNVPNVLKAHEVLNKEIGIGARHITISTVGVRGSIEKLAYAQLQSVLAVSLHAPNQELRETIIPSAKVYPMEDLLQDCEQYFIATGRRVTFEYTLLGGVNDQPEHAKELGRLLYARNLASHVNLIPYNPVDDADFKRPSRATVYAFRDVLEQERVPASIRQTRGLEAAAACGQLRNAYQKNAMTASA